jgi:3-phosphoshikimate 1-carboxyvinyltransferase
MTDSREVIPLKGPIHLTLELPGSKSITNRALLCAALAKGKSVLKGALESDDTQVMRAALSQKGSTLDLHNAGTAVRFLTAAMALRPQLTRITGSARMQERPIGDLIEALKPLGIKVKYLKKKGFPPFEITGIDPRTLKKPVTLKVRGDKSSQYVSALYLILPLLPKGSRIQIVGKLTSKPYLETTRAVMKAFKGEVGKGYTAATYFVEGDASAASYFTALQKLHGGTLKFTNLNKKSVQGDFGFSKTLSRLGKGVIPMQDMPDVAMTLAVLAGLYIGRTKITGLHTLKIKETDRLRALEKELKKVGIRAKAGKDFLEIRGGVKRDPGEPNILIETYKDHRMAMCFAVLGSKVPGLQILDPGCVGKTYPKFWEDLERVYLAPLHLGKKDLLLTGMRGSGKTYVGKRIAKYLGRPFIDLDDEIRADQGMSISEIVKKHGWNYFRQVEQRICSYFAGRTASPGHRYYKTPLVIATGGGVVLDSKNMESFAKHSVNVFLFADPHTLADRVMRGEDRPPLMGKDAVEEIAKLWQMRRPLYLKFADRVWDNTSGNVITLELEKIFKGH